MTCYLRKPSLIVPLAPANPTEAAQWVTRLQGAADAIDLIEWRAEALDRGDGNLPETLADVFAKLAAAEIPILATWRTEDPATVPTASYAAAIRALIALKPSYIDIEAANTEAINLARQARANNIGVIASYHVFGSFPAQLDSLFEMCRGVGDIQKVALRVTTISELEQLEQAARRASELAPTIALGMGELGRTCRAYWAQWGMAATFATLGYCSAPGQPSVDEVIKIWHDLGLR